MFLSATPLNLRQSDLFNLLELLKPGEFLTEAILRERLQPNEGLQQIAVSARRSQVSNEQRRAWLAAAVGTKFGASLPRRPEYRDLERLLAEPSLTARAAAEVKRAVDGLHGLSGVLTRTKKADIQDEKPIREPKSIAVQLTGAEQSFYDEYYQWCVDRAKAVRMSERFVMQMPLRLASSCLPAAAKDVLNFKTTVIDDLDSFGETSRKLPTIMPSADLKRLAKTIQGIDSKFDSFVTALDEMIADGRQVLVFSFSRQTLAYLEHRLTDRFRVATLHGGVSTETRQTVMAAFRAKRFDVILASRVASEGLDFEFCSAVINYDIPWNPMEVEQRIGRIDRIGQQSPKILAGYFHVPGTLETDILVRVMERIRVFEEAIGELEPIISDQLSALEKVVFDFDLSIEERRQKAEQIAVAAAGRELAKDDVEAAAAELLSCDNALIEGLENDLVGTGRYLGQDELAGLVTDWVRQHGGISTVEPGRLVTVRGNLAIADQVRALIAAKVRRVGEVAELGSRLAQEMDVVLSLDAEWSRTGGPELLTATHPLVLAAKRRPTHRQNHFGALRLSAGGAVSPGRYLVLQSEAVWHGHRPTHEIWSTCIDLNTCSVGPAEVSDLVWANVASATTSNVTAQSVMPDGESLRRAMTSALNQMEQRRSREEVTRQRENDAFHETRRLSLQNRHDSEIQVIQQRIATLRERQKDKMIPLQEAQWRNARRRHEDAMRGLEGAANCYLDLSHFAVCLVEVTG